MQTGAAMLLAACAGPLSTLAPAGPAAGAIAALWWAMLAGSAVIFAGVMILYAQVMRQPGWGSGVAPERWIVLGGLVLPGVVLVPLLADSLITGERSLPHVGTAHEHIEAEGRQWRWTFRYPDEGGVETVGVLHLPAGVPVDVAVRSADVIHSFWIPRFAGKIDAVPGHVNILRIEADEPGRYEGQCSEFCGVGHTSMRFAVIVHPADRFSAAVAEAAAASSKTNERDR